MNLMYYLKLKIEKLILFFHAINLKYLICVGLLEDDLENIN